MFAGLSGSAFAAGELRADPGGLSGCGESSAPGVPVGVGESCKGLAPRASGASDAELLGGCPGADESCRGVNGDCPEVNGDCPGVDGRCSDGETVAGVAAVVGLPGGVPGAGEALLLTFGEGTRLPACGARLGLARVGPEAGDAVGDAVGAALVPVGGDASGAGDALAPVDVDGDAPEPVG